MSGIVSPHWTGVVLIILVLFTAALAGSGRRARDPGSVPFAGADLTHWNAGGAAAGRWEGYYERHCAAAARRVAAWPWRLGCHERTQ
jgi:hypothetical protein